MPKISLILPVYNVESYLKECLDSIVNQSFKDIEIICVNDGSTDGSLEILNFYSSLDKRFIVISQKNQGQGVARNQAIDIAKGEYLFFIDPDDWIEKDALETIYNYAKNNDAEAVKFNYSEYNDYSGKIKKIDFSNQIQKKYSYDLNKTPYFNWKNFKKGCLWVDTHVWSYLYSTEFIKSNNIRFAPNKNGEDHIFVTGALLLATKVHYIDKYLYFYRCRQGSAVNKKSDDNFCVFDNISIMKDFLIKHSLYTELKSEFIKYAHEMIYWHYELIPEGSLEKYKSIARQYFINDKDLQAFLKRPKKTFIEWIFSLKSRKIEGLKYKIITIFGFEIVIKPKKHNDV